MLARMLFILRDSCDDDDVRRMKNERGGQSTATRNVILRTSFVVVNVKIFIYEHFSRLEGFDEIKLIGILTISGRFTF